MNEKSDFTFLNALEFLVIPAIIIGGGLLLSEKPNNKTTEPRYDGKINYHQKQLNK
jgi:hypothetical protein